MSSYEQDTGHTFLYVNKDCALVLINKLYIGNIEELIFLCRFIIIIDVTCFQELDCSASPNLIF